MKKRGGMAWWFQIKLWKRVFLGLILGVAFGLAVSQTMDPVAAEALLAKVRVIGDVFIRLIRMIVVPLVFFTLVAGIYAMGDPKKLGTIGVKAFGLYLATTFFANLMGLAMGLIFQPGRGVDLGGAEPKQLGEAQPLGERLMSIIPANPFQALVEGDMLAVIFFALLYGVGLLMAREEGQPAGRFLEAASEGILKMTQLIM